MVTELRCNVEIRWYLSMCANQQCARQNWIALCRCFTDKDLLDGTLRDWGYLVVSTDIISLALVFHVSLWAHQLRYDMFLHLGRLDFAAVDSDGMQWAWGKGLNDQCKRCKQICWCNKGHQGSCGGQRGQLCRNLKLQDRNLIAIFDVIVYVVAKP